MAGKRRAFSKSFKAKVALAAVRGDKTLSQLAAEFKIHVSQVAAWRAKLLADVADLFEDGRRRPDVSDEPAAEELYEQIGRLKMELEWLKKKSARFD